MTEPGPQPSSRRLGQLEEELTRRRRAEEALRQSGERLRLLIEQTRDVVYRYNMQPRGFEYISPTVTDITGYPASAFYDDPDLVLDIVHADDRALLAEYLEAGDFTRPLALRVLRRDGSVVWLEQRGVPSYDTRGELVAIEGLARDVSNYRGLLEGLEHRSLSFEERERLVSAFHRIGSETIASLDLDHVLDTLAEQVVRAGIFRSLMIALVDHQAATVRVARNYLSFEGRYEDGIGRVRPGAEMTPSPTVARRDGERIVFSDQKIIGTTYDLDDSNITPSVARSGQLTVIDGGDDRFDPRFETHDQAWRDACVSYFIPVRREGRVLAVLATGSTRAEKQEILRRIEVMEPLLEQAAVALDHAFIHARVRSDARELHDLNERLRDEVSRRMRVEETLREFSTRTVHLAEEERRRVARELHDGVNQLLCVVGFGLDAAVREAAGNGNGGGELEHAREVLNQSIQEVRRISQDLRPGVLDDLGLAAAVRSLCGEFSKRTGIAATHDLAGLQPDSVPSEIAITVYRLLQESLYHLERQEDTGSVDIRLTTAVEGLVTELTDSGRAGLSDDESLQNMRERAGLLGGQLSLESMGDGGSRLRLVFPLPRPTP